MWLFGGSSKKTESKTKAKKPPAQRPQQGHHAGPHAGVPVTSKAPSPVPPKPKTAESEASDAIKELNARIEQMEKRRKMVEVKILHEDEVVKDKVKRKDKAGAKMALMRKNAYVKQQTTIDNQILTVQNQCLQLENAATNAQAVMALRKGLDTQKNIQKEVNADKVEELFDDLAEQNDLQNEIGDLFQGQADMMGADMDFDAELDALETEMLEEQLIGEANSIPTGPVAGKTAVSTQPVATPASAAAAPAAAEPAQSEDDKQLQELMATLAM